MKIKFITKCFSFIIYFAFVSFSNAQCWTSIEAGYRHTIAIKNDGTLWSWGRMNGTGSLNEGAFFV